MTPQQISEIKETIEGIGEDVNQIKVALIGNKQYNQKGLIDNVREIEMEMISHKLNLESGFKNHAGRIDELEKGNFKRNAIVGAVSGTGGVLLGAGIKSWLVRLFS